MERRDEGANAGAAQVRAVEPTGAGQDERIMAAARAMAKVRLRAHSFSPKLPADLVAELRQSAEDKLWPTLLEEAEAAVEAADEVARRLDRGRPAAAQPMRPARR
jgi:hypothetical protein